MSHTVKLKYLDTKNKIPNEYKNILDKLILKILSVNKTINNLDISYNENEIELHTWSTLWCYDEDITELIETKALIKEDIKIYNWLKNNTILVESQYDNLNDGEEFKSTWDEIEESIVGTSGFKGTFIEYIANYGYNLI